MEIWELVDEKISLDWQPMVSLEEGISRTYKWMMTNNLEQTADKKA